MHKVTPITSPGEAAGQHYLTLRGQVLLDGEDGPDAEVLVQLEGLREPAWINEIVFRRAQRSRE